MNARQILPNGLIRGARSLGVALAAALALSVVAAPAQAARATTPAPTSAVATVAGAAATAEVAAQLPDLLPMKNRNCGWGLKTKYHSCDLARALTLLYLQEGYPTYLGDVFSPNSGKYYDFWCSGSSTVTCRSSKGRVTIKLWQVPELRACGADDYGQDIVAWGAASCVYAIYTGDAYAEQQSSVLTNVYEPANGRYYRMFCYNNGQSVVCFNNRDWVVIRP